MTARCNTPVAHRGVEGALIRDIVTVLIFGNITTSTTVPLTAFKACSYRQQCDVWMQVSIWKRHRTNSGIGRSLR